MKPNPKDICKRGEHLYVQCILPPTEITSLMFFCSKCSVIRTAIIADVLVNHETQKRAEVQP